VVLSEQGLTAFANLMGHTAFLQAASYAVSLIVRIVDRELSVPPQLLRTCWDLLADAAILIALPHAPGAPGLGPGREDSFVRKMRSIMDMPYVWVPMDAARARVLEAWRSLEHSGIIQQRHIDLKIHVGNVLGENVASTAAAAAAAPGLRTCGLASCGACGARGAPKPLQVLRRLPHPGVLLQGAPDRALARTQGGLQGGTQGCCRAR
jgi:hypothetical protein